MNRTKSNSLKSICFVLWLLPIWSSCHASDDGPSRSKCGIPERTVELEVEAKDFGRTLYKGKSSIQIVDAPVGRSKIDRGNGGRGLVVNPLLISETYQLVGEPQFNLCSLHEGDSLELPQATPYASDAGSSVKIIGIRKVVIKGYGEARVLELQIRDYYHPNGSRAEYHSGTRLVTYAPEIGVTIRLEARTTSSLQTTGIAYDFNYLRVATE